ncbi:hypothetical protein LTR62_001119 [Meristemomyces frigidus]|uniref:DOPA-dioxygenase n=1 Tax=Meristemomyces frigidus TaxID=1508187 RepID=A0AAN7TLZ0_9PEZI|nr:hypothetical protein LTR62_001119 [Meristemomyces frigidus]
MADPSLYTFPSPLLGWEGGEPLSKYVRGLEFDRRSTTAAKYKPSTKVPSKQTPTGPNAKSFINPTPTKKSSAYTSFASPITNGTRAGFDAHIYFHQQIPSETTFATELWERIRREFPELRIYKVWDRPIGPHPLAMFEVNIHTPEQFGAFVPWLVIHRGPLSVLVHPNTGDDVRDHTQRATWMGESIPLVVGFLREHVRKQGTQAEGAEEVGVAV